MLYARPQACRCKSKKSCTFFDRDFLRVLFAEPVQLVQFAGDCWARLIQLPAALPAIAVGLQLSLGYSWRALIGAELIAASSGIGYMILDAEQMSRPDIVLVGLFAIGIVGSLIDWLFLALTNKILPWNTETGDKYAA